jgi:hypothetical protein
MSGKNQATHDYIVFKLAEALKQLVQAQRDTVVQKGYKNFELAIDIVHSGKQRAMQTRPCRIWNRPERN